MVICVTKTKTKKEKEEKKPRLTDDQVQLIYEIYDKNMKETGLPGYANIVNKFLTLKPPVHITKAAISYRIDQRKKKSQITVEAAKQNLEQAKEEHFEITGEQPQELDFSSSKEITEKNAITKLRYYEAQTAKFKYEQMAGKYIHIDEFKKEAERIKSTMERCLNVLKTQMLPMILPAIENQNKAAAEEIIYNQVNQIIDELHKVLTN